MLQAMYNGVSAIQATQEDMDILGNNIANVDTTAYKGSDATFADELSQLIQGGSAGNGSTGGTNPIQTGTGVRISSISTVVSQGSLLSTSSPTDMAIQGNGYFVLASASSGMTYTRDGHFALDNSGRLVDASTGAYVLGWTASGTGKLNSTAQITAASSIQIPIGNQAAVQATQNISLGGNLSADDAAGDTYTTNETVYDSLGQAHTVDVTFTREKEAKTGNGSNVWSWTATPSPATDKSLAPPAGTTNMGTVTFNGNGQLSASTGGLLLNPTGGATAGQQIALNFGSMSQVSGASTVSPTSQDGFPPGSLQSFNVDQNGVITGVYSNGLIRPLGQIAIAGFTNPQGLNAAGDNQYTPSPNSGSANIGPANTLGLGSIATGYLEQSNVDLGTQLSNMVVVQNAFEANTKIVTAVDQMLSTLIQMKQ